MPTPSEPMLRGEWAARTDIPKRSVFGNYHAGEHQARSPVAGEREPSSPRPAGEGQDEPELDARIATTFQRSVDLAVARSFIHRFLAKAYEDPTLEGWHWLGDSTTQESLRAAWNVVGSAGDPPASLGDSPSGSIGRSSCKSHAAPVSEVLVGPSGESPDSTGGSPVPPNPRPDAFGQFVNAYLAAFGHAARGSCPLNEIEYGDIKADPLFQPHRLADLAAFYRAFGLEVTEEAGERHDHICLELEFMCVLAAKEAHALEQRLDAEQLALCRDAQMQFLREHLGRWTPAFARRLAASSDESTLRALAEFTRAFVEAECVRFDVHPGSEELALRAVDETADRMCDSCGINNLPPGALATT